MLRLFVGIELSPELKHSLSLLATGAARREMGRCRELSSHAALHRRDRRGPGRGRRCRARPDKGVALRCRACDGRAFRPAPALGRRRAQRRASASPWQDRKRSDAPRLPAGRAPLYAPCHAGAAQRDERRAVASLSGRACALSRAAVSRRPFLADRELPDEERRDLRGSGGLSAGVNRALQKAVAADAVEGGPTPTATIARETHHGRAHDHSAKDYATENNLRNRKINVSCDLLR